MTSKFNKKKINLIPNRKFATYLIISVLFLSFLTFTYNEFMNTNKFYSFIQNISEKFNYQFLNLKINSTSRVDKSRVLKIINKHYKKSIFLIPLRDISESLYDLNWVKGVNISTNFKNTVNVEIFEYTPIGLLSFNNQLFYFSSEGKIIDKYKNKFNENLIIFHGKQVLKEANKFLKSLVGVKKIEMIKIKEVYYVNKRRWDIKLHNDIFLNLSEKNIEDSFNNYIKLIEKLNNSEINSIYSIDLRNNEKAIIRFK
jgi:cell division septal protein FtsQ